ncbi:MAG: hypothetical protein AAGC44_01185 [Planctomycetota bacterium]
MATAWPAQAQFGPPRGDPNSPEPTRTPGPSPVVDPNRDPGPAPGPNPGPDPEPVGLGTPQWLRPGYQATFAQFLTHQPNPTGDANQPAPKGRASQKLFEYTAIAVTQDRVIFQVSQYEGHQGLPTTGNGMFDPSVDGKYRPTDTYYKSVDAKLVSQGSAIWMPVGTLQGLAQQPIQQQQTDQQNGVQTQATTWPQAGQQVNALTIQVLGKELTELLVFNRDTGLRIFIRVSEGKPRPGAQQNDPFNREFMLIESLVGEAQVNSPLIGAAFPRWTETVKSMRYEGTQSVGTLSIPVAATLTVEQNDGRMMQGKLLLQAQGSPDETKEVYMGPGSHLGYWVDPAVLAQMQEGTVHRNPVTRGNLYYRVQETDLGRLGVFVSYNDSQSFISVNGYSLEDGSLVYVKFETPDANVTREMYLKNIERR